MTSLINILLEPMQYPFMLRGLIAAIVVGIVCAVIGTYVVLRGMAFFGDALAHAILPGVALGYLVQGGSRGALFWWSMATAVLASLGIGAIRKGTRIQEDTAIGIVFAGMFALGIVLISQLQNATVDLTHLLFGDVLGVSSQDLWLTGLFAMLILFIIFLFYKEFLVIAFDPLLASTLRLPARILELLLLVLIAMTVVVSLQTVGVALMVAMLITPAAAAFLLTRRMLTMMAVASAIACLSGVIGLYLSFYLGIASGAVIVLTCTSFFLAAWLVKFLASRK